MTKRRINRRFKNDNNGSALLAVVAAMLFVVGLGTALLYAAYTGLQVSATARSDKSNFYDASAAMDAVKAGIQEEVAAALQLAYSEVLVSYGRGETVDPQSIFVKSFITKLGKGAGGTFTVTEENPISPTKVQVSVQKLQALATQAYGGTATLTADATDANGKVESVIGNGTITVKGIKINCINPKGYESNISTDLVINIPDFFSGSAVSASLGEYTIIANQALNAKTLNPSSVTGGVYVGSGGINVGNPLTFGRCNLIISGGKIVSAGKITVGNGSELSMGSTGYDIWAQEIESAKNSSVNITGNTHVEDDLILNSGSKVKLTGRYYGFGSDDAGTPTYDDDKSSSIFVNSYESKNEAGLNIGGLEQMCIAGVSFINGRFPSGQSIAVKTDQLAYLVPAEAIKNYKSNPTVLKYTDTKKTNPIPAEINKSTVLWTIDGVNKTLDYYLSKVVNDKKIICGSLVNYYVQGTDVGYVFISFSNQAKANEYFKDYFTAKPEAIKQYLDIYLDLNRHSPSLTDITKGNTYRNSGTETTVNWENVLGTTSFPDSQALFYAKQYKTISEPVIGTYINIDSLNALPSDTVLSFGGTSSNPMAVVTTKTDYTPAAGMTNLRVIIARGDVTINQNFTGIIIAQGKVNVNAQISYCAPSAEVLTSTTSDGTKLLSDYLNTDLFNGQQSTAENKWSPDKLVSYSNWQKE